MITFLSAALKGGKNSTWWLVSILSGDTPLFFCNGLFLFCFLPFITEVLFLQMLKTCPYDICKRFLQSYLIHVSALWAVFILFFCLFSKVLFMQMFKACLSNICERFVAKFFDSRVRLVGGFHSVFCLFFENFVSANVQSVSV